MLMTLLQSKNLGLPNKKNTGGIDMEELEKRTMRKVSLRLIPFLIVCYFVAYLDRTNVGFAALTMFQDLGISATAYGLGAGIFFLTYFVFEVPSNLALERFGARRWIARIMVSWGILSGCMAFIGGEWSFYIVRLLLGAAEAGFFPGIIFYLTLWFPAVYRARIVGLFMAAIPGSTVFGAPLSSALLYMGWHRRAEGMAVDVHPGSAACDNSLGCRAAVPGRSALGSAVAEPGRARMAERTH
jgi:MFS family permease